MGLNVRPGSAPALVIRPPRYEGRHRLHPQGLVPRPAWRTVAALPALAYLGIHFGAVPHLPASVGVYVIQPLVWGVAGVVAILVWRKWLAPVTEQSFNLVALALLIGSFQIAVGVLGGLVAGFGASPVGHDADTLVRNIVFVGSALLAMELCRAVVVTGAPRRPTLTVAVTAVYFALLTIPVAAYQVIDSPDELFRFGGETLLPALAMSVLASALVSAGGPWPAVAYRGILAAFEWLSPVLPDLEWITVAFVGTIGPIIGLMILSGRTEPSPAPEEPAAAERRAQPLMGTTALVVSVAFLVSGMLGVQFTPVIGSSMSPAFEPGHLLVTRNVAAEEIEVGDVIRYRLGETFVLHRVIDIWEGRPRRVFITQGDGNNVEDPLPVEEEQLAGEVVLALPKAGWVFIWARQLIDRF